MSTNPELPAESNALSLPSMSGVDALSLLEPLELTRPWIRPLPLATDGCTGSLSSSFRHSGWARHRKLVFESLCRTRQSNARLRAFGACGSHAYVLQSVKNPDKYRLAGSTCHDRFCVPCAKERSATIVRNVLGYLTGDPVRFLTLTLRAKDEPLAVSARRLTQCFAKLRRTSLWREKVTGGVAFIEVHWSKNGLRWHPHLHCLIQGKYVDNKELSRLWHDITTDSHIIDIRLVKNVGQLARYVTKYASKPLEASFIDDTSLLDEAIDSLRGKRLCLTFGDWQGLQLTTSPNDDDWHNLGQFENFVYRAALGDAEALAIVRSVAGPYADSLLADARVARPPPDRKAEQFRQMTFFSIWNGTATL